MSIFCNEGLEQKNTAVESNLGVSREMSAERAQWRKQKKRKGGGKSSDPALEPQSKVFSGSGPPDQCGPDSLITRLYGTCARQMDRIEQRLESLGVAEADLGDLDKAVKLLAGLARTLDLLSALQKSQKHTDVEEGEDDANPDDIRHALAARLHHLCSDGEGRKSA